MFMYINPNLGGSFWGGGGGVKFPLLSKTRYNYARNLKFGA